MTIKTAPKYLLLFVIITSACQASLDGSEKIPAPTLTVLPTESSTATPVSTLSPLERLAEPTLPASPSSADHGAYVYWLWCSPCHGDRGQGLTDEFRQLYPPDHQYCWERGCHGARPYEDGFTIPMYVPALIGTDANLGKFADAAILQAYISETMPYWNPGILTEDEDWQVTAFILRENGIEYGQELNDLNAKNISLLLPSSPEPEPDGPFAYKMWILAVVPLVVYAIVALLVYFPRKRSN